MQANIFDRIAPGWYNFRHRSIFPRELGDIAHRWQKGKLLNAGCAHGPDFVPFTANGLDFELNGIDISSEMLRLALKYSRKFAFDVNLYRADVSSLPFKNDVFDWAISVATYHHLQTPEGRLAGISELKRVLKPGGEAFITVWNRWQPRFWLKGKEVYVPWRTGGEILQRYYYLFTYAEIEKLCREVGFIILKSFPEYAYRFPVKHLSRNICLLLKKPPVI